MAHPLTTFAVEASRLLDLARSEESVSDSQLVAFVENKWRLDFLSDLVGRARILQHCHDSLLALTDQYRKLQAHIRALPPDHPDSNVRTIPAELVEEEERILVAVDASTSLIYYEVVSVGGMLRQLGVALDTLPEVRFLTKVRDRFFAHVQLAGVQRGHRGGSALPAQGFLALDVIALNSWSSEDLRALGSQSLTIGSSEWEEQRRANEQLTLSEKRNERFTQCEIQALHASGVRECNLPLALHELGEFLLNAGIPLIREETQRATREFGYERWED